MGLVAFKSVSDCVNWLWKLAVGIRVLCLWIVVVRVVWVAIVGFWCCCWNCHLQVESASLGQIDCGLRFWGWMLAGKFVRRLGVLVGSQFISSFFFSWVGSWYRILNCSLGVWLLVPVSVVVGLVNLVKSGCVGFCDCLSVNKFVRRLRVHIGPQSHFLAF